MCSSTYALFFRFLDAEKTPHIALLEAAEGSHVSYALYDKVEHMVYGEPK
jgi:hypothetical protein